MHLCRDILSPYPPHQAMLLLNSFGTTPGCGALQELREVWMMWRLTYDWKVMFEHPFKRQGNISDRKSSLLNTGNVSSLCSHLFPEDHEHLELHLDCFFPWKR